MRKILLGEIKEKNKEVKKHARRYFMTPEIEEYRKEKRKDQDIDKVIGVLDQAENLQMKNRERRLGERKLKGQLGGLNGS